MAKERNVLFIVLFALSALVMIAFVLFYVFALTLMDRDIGLGDAVGVVDLNGEIVYDQAKIDEIERFRKDDKVKAVLLHINSPGGGVGASQELYHSVIRLREKKPVVACLGEVAASGAYYVASAADSIVALEGTLTGSIGVIAVFWRTEELLRKVGVEVSVIKSGKLKDVPSPYRRMSEEERAYLHELLDSVYRQFIRAVSEGRGIPLERVEKLAEGRLYSGEEALEKGLVDRTGTYQDALEMAARMGGIEGRYRVVKRRKRPEWIERFLGGRIAGLALVGEEAGIRLKYILP